MRVILLQEDDGFDQMVMAEDRIADAIRAVIVDEPALDLSTTTIVQSVEQLATEAEDYRRYLEEENE
jgi:hypothetical protein